MKKAQAAPKKKFCPRLGCWDLVLTSPAKHAGRQAIQQFSHTLYRAITEGEVKPDQIDLAAHGYIFNSTLYANGEPVTTMPINLIQYSQPDANFNIKDNLGGFFTIHTTDSERYLLYPQQMHGEINDFLIAAAPKLHSGQL